MLRFQRLLLSLIALAFLACTPAVAKNVPGSSAAVQGRVDRQIASNLVDLAVQSAIDSSNFQDCDTQYKPTSYDRRTYCEWGFSANGEMLHLDGDPNGYRYKSTAGVGNVMISRWISPDTAIVGGVLFEVADTDTNYNRGGVDQNGLGATIGIIHKFSPEMEFSILGGVEGLDYDVRRSNRFYQGNYTATRLFGDAAVSGQAGDDALWLLYRGGVRIISQDNSSYLEEGDDGSRTHVDGVDLFLVSVVGDVKFGTTYENVRPYIEVSGFADIVQDGSADIPGINLDDETWSGRLGAGLDAEVFEGVLSLSSGLYFANEGQTGFDVRLGYSKSF